MNKITNITIGADPELFIINKKTGRVVSSIGLIPGVKGKPWVGDDMPSGFGLEIDNILAEFNIPPARDKISFVNSIEYMKNYIQRYVQEKNPNLDILCAASQKVPVDQLKSPEARLFGCSVDYNVYTESANPKPNGEKTNTRSGGFHIHCGYQDYNTGTSLQLIKYFDMYLGIPSILWDTDTQRRSLYGRAGCFRLTGYGFEYRVLSSAMMKTPELIGKVWDCVMRAINAYNHRLPLLNGDLIQGIVNENKTDLAERIISEYNILPETKHFDGPF